MSIRSNANTKDHLRHKAGETVLSLVESPSPRAPEDGELLQFRTSHPTQPCVVDLSVFKLGQQTRQGDKKGSWQGPFTGRPELIAQLAPALRDQLAPLAERSVQVSISSLRTWWRLLDAVEAATGKVMPPVTSVAELTDLHRQHALDRGISRVEFSAFLRVVNTTRSALKLKPLYWKSPERLAPNRHLPPRWQTDMVRMELKRRWFAVIDRWSLADQLRRQRAPTVDRNDHPQVYAEQARLLRNYERLDAVIAETGRMQPSRDLFREGDSVFYHRGFNLSDMLRGSYPDGDDVRAAFHLCLATTGWNAAVLLSLDVADGFIEQHPRDKRRYILRGTKTRAGGAEQLNEGLFKSQGSAGFVIQTLIARTSPLREALKADLDRCKAQLLELTVAGTDKEAEVVETRARITSLEQGLRSPWIFHSDKGTKWLKGDNFGKRVKQGDGREVAYLGAVIAEVNARQPKDRQLARLKPSDFRDAYAAYVYHLSGGSVLAVMKALGHRVLSSTPRYLHNTLLKEEHRKLFGTFSDALWAEMEIHGRVDPTVLAHRSRYGGVSDEQRERLRDYRTLAISRIGVGCLDPTNPPQHIDPNFQRDGQKMCHVQRCTLCVEHAVILPESLPGLSKRLAELRHLRAQMSVAAFQMSSFLEEMENTELALMAFAAEDRDRLLGDWSDRIRIGKHRVAEYDGLAQEVSE